LGPNTFIWVEVEATELDTVAFEWATLHCLSVEEAGFDDMLEVGGDTVRFTTKSGLTITVRFAWDWETRRV
jgi:hypothetical protein